MRRLLVDGQLFHTPAWHRGMGKYSYELLKALALQNQHSQKWHTIEIILSSKYDHEQEMISMLEGIKGVKITLLPLEKNRSADPLSVLKENREIIDSYIDSLESIKENIDYVILSLMQSEISPAFPSNGSIHKGLLYYDLIPLMFNETYLSSPVVQKEYLSKLTELMKADTYFGISKTVANDISLYLGIDPERVISIDGGGVSHGERTKKFAVNKPFILMPTGNDLRKNNRRGIQAFAQFNARHNNKYALVITSSFKEEEQLELQKISVDVIFTGNISGEELNYLYDHSLALLFPSEYEGLGMPILEAMEKGKPVACSDIAVFREITKRGICYFDPLRVNDIAAAISKAITLQPDLELYKKVLRKYNWTRTAKLFAEKISSSKTVNHQPKIKLHITTPNPGSRYTGKKVQLAHGELSRLADIEYYVDDYSDQDNLRANVLSQTGTTHAALSKLSNQDNFPSIYYIDGSESSAQVLFVALLQPGIVILDSQDTEQAWLKLVRDGLISKERLNLEQAIDHAAEVHGLLATVISRQKAIVCLTKENEGQASAIARELKSPVKICLLKVPANVIKYHDVLPDKTVDIVSAELLLTKSDMQYEELLSRAIEIDYKRLTKNQKSTVEADAGKYPTVTLNIYGYKLFAQDLVKIIKDIYGGSFS